MNFLQCAAETSVLASCYNLSASGDDFLNPFTGVSTSASGVTDNSPAANGILLQIPWCGFQTGAGSGESAPTLGECHYQVWGTSGTGTIYAGAYQIGTTQYHQLYPPGSMGTDPQGGVDPYIANLSTCTNTYDIGPACSSGVLDTALNDIVTIAQNMPAGTSLKLAVSLMAGEYTPTSVMGTVSTLDFPQAEGMHGEACERQPLAWHTTSVSPFVATTYEKEYGYAVSALGTEIHRISASNGNVLTLNIVKQSAITSNSIEFDVAARTAIEATATDPAASSPPQGGAQIQCPDQYTTSESMVAALLNAYAATGSSLIMADAYEYTFGFVMGLEEGLASQSGIVSGALLSIPNKGGQTFAHVDCGVAGSETTCAADPTTVNAYIYDWDEYYFWKFLSDISSSGTPAATGATAGYAKACAGTTCSPTTISTISATQMSTVYTGLNPTTETEGQYISYPQCWINNTDSSNDYSLRLYSSASAYTTQLIGGTGVVLGWQTMTGDGSDCRPGHTYDLRYGLDNGAQYLEIQTDAAAEEQCDSNLGTTLGTLTSTAGNTMTSCFY